MISQLSLRAQLALFCALYYFRALNGEAVETFFQPDEFFQSLEPAWQWAFGQTSGAWITWVRRCNHVFLNNTSDTSAGMERILAILRTSTSLLKRISVDGYAMRAFAR
jgi:hypothetical protein